MPEDTDWLEGCVPWDGREASLPAGYQGPAGITAVKLIKEWIILDAESEAGFTTKKTADLQKDDVIIGANPNNKSIAIILNNYGNDAFRFTDANGKYFHPKAWFDQYGTNVFALVAIRNKMMELRGGGVHF